MTLKGRRIACNIVKTQCGHKVYSKVFHSRHSLWYGCTLYWLLNHFKTPSPPPHRLHRRSGPKKTIKKDMVGARLSRLQHSRTSERSLGLMVCPLVRFNLLQNVNTKCDSIYCKTRQWKNYWLQNTMCYAISKSMIDSRHRTPSNGLRRPCNRVTEL